MRQLWLTGCLILCLCFGAQAGEAPSPSPPHDPWGALRQLVGTWEGDERGEPGVGKGERSYEFVLGGRYMQCRNVSRYPPQDANPRGEVHEDWKFFSYDRMRGLLALREFHGEGFVNTYLLDTGSSSTRRWVFVSRDLENFDGRARYTIELSESGNRLREIFEVGRTGKPLAELLHNEWTRRPD